jgi:cobyrinic acid a,c-diamide synthase
MTRQVPRLLIAGTASGVGKTTVMAALTVALKRRGLRVATFKCGPDYLDPTYHVRASGHPCHNLDGWMMGREAVIATFLRATLDADIALIEGVMGFYDGASPTGDAGSAAEIAKWLGAPVALVVDGSGMARSIAAVVKGFEVFDPAVSLRGVFASRLGSRSHGELLRKASHAYLANQTFLGGMPEDPSLAFASRHLGLQSARHGGVGTDVLGRLGDVAQEWFDLEAVLRLANEALPLDEAQDALAIQVTPRSGEKPRIGIALDLAFDFYYEDNLRRLEALGAELVYFSPLEDERLPAVDALYFGGGYPELHASRLGDNGTMKDDIRAFAASGGPIYAECGGLIYLSQDLTLLDGQQYPMVGLLPGSVTMGDRLKALGYVEVETQVPTILGSAGTRFRGHQFRYSDLTVPAGDTALAYAVRRRRDQQTFHEGYVNGSVLGSYVHAHWASNPAVPAAFVKKAAERVSLRRLSHE